MKPLSPRAIARANKVVAQLGRCVRRSGYEVGVPDVRNRGLGRASFGFKPLPGSNRHTRGYWQGYTRALHACEKRVDIARKLSKIIDEDRRPDAGDNL